MVCGETDEEREEEEGTCDRPEERRQVGRSSFAVAPEESPGSVVQSSQRVSSLWMKHDEGMVLGLVEDSENKTISEVGEGGGVGGQTVFPETSPKREEERVLFT
jgi:hypothetical protein